MRRPDTETWWVINGEQFAEALCRANAGEDPELLYVEYYANTKGEPR